MGGPQSRSGCGEEVKKYHHNIQYKIVELGCLKEVINFLKAENY
jgi:hypothetical protein